MITQLKKSCPGCLRLNKKYFSSYEASVLDLLKTIQPSFAYGQADIFGPILAYNNAVPLKRWVLVNMCLKSRAVHMELLLSYTVLSITRDFQRTFALRGTPWIIWIDAGLNIVKSGKYLIQLKVKIVSALNIKFSAIEYRATLPKHHEGIRAVERILLV